MCNVAQVQMHVVTNEGKNRESPLQLKSELGQNITQQDLHHTTNIYGDQLAQIYGDQLVQIYVTNLRKGSANVPHVPHRGLVDVDRRDRDLKTGAQAQQEPDRRRYFKIYQAIYDS